MIRHIRGHSNQSDLRHIAFSLYLQSTVQMTLLRDNSPISCQVVIQDCQRNDFQDS